MAARTKPNLSEVLAARSEAARIAADLECALIAANEKLVPDIARMQAHCAFFERVLLDGAASAEVPEPATGPTANIVPIKGGR